MIALVVMAGGGLRNDGAVKAVAEVLGDQSVVKAASSWRPWWHYTTQSIVVLPERQRLNLVTDAVSIQSQNQNTLSMLTT